MVIGYLLNVVNDGKYFIRLIICFNFNQKFKSKKNEHIL